MIGVVVPDLLAHGARRYPDKLCVAEGTRSLTFSMISERAARLAAVLRYRGLAGRRVALLAMNELEYLEIWVATQRAGATLVPLNYRMTASELVDIVTDAEPSLLIVGPDCAELAAALPVPDVLWLAPENGPDCGYHEAMARVEPEAPPAALPAENIGLLCYTSGTTSRPKGVMLSNAAIHATTAQMGHEMAASPDATYLAVNPMFHIGHTVGFSFVYLGGSHIQLRKFDVESFLALLDRGAITHTQLVPAMVRTILDSSGHRSPRGLRRVMYGAAPMPPELAGQTLASWGCDLVNGYGSTESMGISMLAPHEHDPEDMPHLLASVGRSSPGMTVRLVDEDGRDVSVGETGEIITRGPNLMSGYWRRPDATEQVLRDGWMHTGDLGYRDDQGYLYLVDRRGDKVVTGGENVFPTEVEHILLTHPAVLDAAVIGVPDLRWGEMVSAVVVLQAGPSTSDGELIEYCRRSLAGFKVPKQVRAVTQLPRTATGKLLRRVLRDRWAELGRLPVERGDR